MTTDPTQQLVREGERAAVLLERIRTQLTVVRGFAGLLQRRAQASGATDPAVRRIDDAAAALARLLEDFETATQLAIRHPGTRPGERG